MEREGVEGESLDEEETLPDLRCDGYGTRSGVFLLGREFREWSLLKRVMLLYLYWVELMSTGRKTQRTGSWLKALCVQESRSSRS
jgi:hypothetical protein